MAHQGNTELEESQFGDFTDQSTDYRIPGQNCPKYLVNCFLSVSPW